MSDITLTADQWEDIGRAIDQIDNVVTSLTVMRALPDHIHVEAMRGVLPEIRDDLKRIWRDADKGETP